ncbi:hypothetical protein AWM79_07125 [Pseudomonas agarici]|uniref:DUF1468 domain-containing protein n=1 Tax=Pseudomonas agarici TaxID=46677 RepID=A0A0X1SZ45_PSEAA|nr:tripartite tricarboxylate transporter TctB family protein [Pseudomonas agarici]AMB85091.1 hypothetical protein AWM79_07125 [Pseudomonas agarici]NWB91418.1 tripartite tricarboxylate transporter TctB family protein [Pseudomonas agarici]NWC07834.1 tripartite tricarboxylate transporter TctB family protein [Pseudomonas agarici]SEK75667.1 Tripartite tricarboxylate transporter TctB family protein [Pseudomonas agarici]
MRLRRTYNGQVLTALAMAGFFLATTAIAFSFPPQARLLPLMVGVPGSILGLAQLYLELHKVVAPTDNNAKKDMQKKEAEMFLWIFTFFIGILFFGFVYAAPVLIFGFLYLYKKEKVKVAIVSAIGIWLLLFGLFEKLFEIPLFPGLILEWLIG